MGKEQEYKGLQFFNESSTELATIYVDGPIGFESWDKERDRNTARKMIEELDRIKNLKAKKILVLINSLGGYVNHALAIRDVLEDHPAEVTFKIIGMCASAATFLSFAAPIERRKISNYSLLLPHKCSSGVWGNENDLEAELESQRVINDRILKLYVDNGVNEKKAKELMNANNGKGRWITAQEALEFGFVGEIYNETQKVASISEDVFNAYKLPALPSGYENLISSEEKKDNWWDAFKDEITAFFGKNSNQKQDNMKKFKDVFPLLFVAMAFQDDKTFEEGKGQTFTDDQLTALEDKFKAFADENKILNDAKEKAEKDLSDMKKNCESLQAKIDNFPNPQGNVPVNGKDQTEEEDTYENRQKDDPYYKNLRESGIVL